MTYAALILAAGASSRLGTPKQLIRIGNETLLDRSVRIAKEAGSVPVVVILGSAEDQIRDQCELQDVLIVSHPDWAKGMGTTISRGVRAFKDVRGILIMTCDMPAVTADHLRTLAGSDKVAASSYGGRNGVPAYFPAGDFPKLLKLEGDMGARELLKIAHAVELWGGELDIDTPDDLAKARSIFG